MMLQSALWVIVIVTMLSVDIDACGFGGGGGGGGCGCGGRKRRDTKALLEDAAVAPERLTNEESRCNSRPLSRIIAKNLADTPATSKTAIHDALHEDLGGDYVVFCSATPVEFSSDSVEYCSGGNGDFKCNVFRID